jgi:predicted Zn-dependent protease
MMIRILLVLAVLANSAAPLAAQPRERLRLIRDAELEHTIQSYSAPVFQAAGLGGVKVKVHIVNDSRLNAFVANGRHIFLFSGLLTRAEHAGQVIGVIAHETGHISGGHLVRLNREIKDAQIKALIALVLAAGAGVAARDGGAAMAGVGLGARIIEGTLYQFSRNQESAADQFGLTILDRLKISARGLGEFLAILREQDMLYAARQDPYLRTHPLTQQRMEEVQRHVARSPWGNAALPRKFEAMHIRMRAKLNGFLRPPEQVIAHYRGKESSVEARYALAVAYHRDAQLERALSFIDSLIREQPQDAYFQELRGQILFESGRVREAVDSYERAVRLAPGEGLIRAGLAQAQLELHDERFDRAALGHLAEAARQDDNYPLTWRLLSTAHGRMGDHGNSALALAEYAYLVQDLPTMRAAVARAERSLRPGSPSYQRLQDIKAQVAIIREDRRRNSD